MRNKLTINGSIWIEVGENVSIGKGRAQLLEEIQVSGSISQAAKNLNITYKKAWCMVKELNNNIKKPIIKQTVGGKNGGGTILTAYGKTLLNKYKKTEEAFLKFREKTQNTLNKHAD